MKAIFAVLMFGMASVCAAEPCADRAAQGLAELKLVFPEMDEAQTDDAERILRDVCVAPEPAQAEPDTPSVLGIEFNKAQPDSKGHSRLKKGH